MQITQTQTSTLIPYAMNAKKHSEHQVSQIAASIKEFGFCNPVLIDNENGIIAGHGRVMAAKKLDMESVPCIVLGHLTEAQRKSYVIADNRLAETGGGWDEEMLRAELEALGKETSWLDLDEVLGDNNENPYSGKIEIPIYEPMGLLPSLDDLVDRSKSLQLVSEIESLDLPIEEKEFLKIAAMRHNAFHYENIAEYYAQSSQRMKDAMEKLALVIVDFDKAMEYGFIELSQGIANQYRKDHE